MFIKLTVKKLNEIINFRTFQNARSGKINRERLDRSRPDCHPELTFYDLVYEGPRPPKIEVRNL
jgi:hypothetical protein